MTDFLFYISNDIIYSEAGDNSLNNIKISLDPFLEISFYDFYTTYYNTYGNHILKENVDTINIKHVIDLPFDKFHWLSISTREKSDVTKLAYEKLILSILLLLHIKGHDCFLNFSETCYLINEEYSGVYTVGIIKVSELKPLYKTGKLTYEEVKQDSIKITLKNRILYLS